MIARSVIFTASAGLVANAVPSGQACRISGPALRQVKRTVDESMALGRDISGEHADLAIGHLAGRPGVLAPHAARCLALFQKSGLVDDQHRIISAQVIERIVAHDVVQGIRIPRSAAQDRLPPPWSRVAGRFGTHPPGLAALVTQQAIQKPVRRRRRTRLAEQGPHPRLHLAQR